MNALRHLAPALLLLFSASVLADTPVLLHADPGRNSESTINLQSSQGASCATPVTGNCGSCSVSCPTGKAATCKPGIAVGGQAGASCVTPPECKCQ